MVRVRIFCDKNYLGINVSDCRFFFYGDKGGWQFSHCVATIEKGQRSRITGYIAKVHVWYLWCEEGRAVESLAAWLYVFFRVYIWSYTLLSIAFFYSHIPSIFQFKYTLASRHGAGVSGVECDAVRVVLSVSRHHIRQHGGGRSSVWTTSRRAMAVRYLMDRPRHNEQDR